MMRLFLLAIVGVGALTTLSGCSEQQIQQAAVIKPSGHMSWSGSVDDSATVYIQGGKAWTDDVTGKPLQNVVANFQGNLPASDGTTVTLQSHTGRGTVEVIQQPTKTDNYTAGVRILDPQPGADDYTFELSW